MTKLLWDQVGERKYEIGVDHGVLYIADNTGAYNNGYAWNGLTTVTESPSGAEAQPQYADNIKYVNLLSVEEFGGTIEAFTYPDEFGQCDGLGSPQGGILIGQQPRKSFGLCYRSQVGNDVDGIAAGYKLHLVYGAQASPSEKAYATVNDSPEPIGFSWDFTTTPVAVGTINGVDYKPTAIITVDSTGVDADALATLEDMLYGTAGTDPELPKPADVVALFSGTVTKVTPTAPTYNAGTHVITIPTTTGVDYTIDGDIVTGTVTITHNTVVVARVQQGYAFNNNVDTDWGFVYS